MSQPKGTGTFWENGKLVERSDDDDPEFEEMVTAAIEKRAKQDRLELEVAGRKAAETLPPATAPAGKEGTPGRLRRYGNPHFSYLDVA